MIRAHKPTVPVILLMLLAALAMAAGASDSTAPPGDQAGADASAAAPPDPAAPDLAAPRLIMLEDLPPAERAYYEQRFREGPRPPAERRGDPAADGEPGSLPLEMRPAERMFSSAANIRPDVPEGAGEQLSDLAHTVKDNVAAPDAGEEAPPQAPEADPASVREVLDALDEAPAAREGDSPSRETADEGVEPGLSGRAAALDHRAALALETSRQDAALIESAEVEASAAQASLKPITEADQARIDALARAALEGARTDGSPDESAPASAMDDFVAVKGGGSHSRVFRPSDEPRDREEPPTIETADTPVAVAPEPPVTVLESAQVAESAPPSEEEPEGSGEEGIAIVRKGGSAALTMPEPEEAVASFAIETTPNANAEPAVVLSPDPAEIALAAAQGVVEKRLSAAATAAPLPGVAAEQDAEMEIGAAEIVPRASGGMVGSIADKLNSKVVEVYSARDAELESVVQLISTQHGLNLIANPEVYAGKRVSFHFENIRLGVLLENLLRAHDLAYVPDDENNLIRVVRAEDLGLDRVETETEAIEIKWVKAAALVTTLESFITGGKQGGGGGGGGGQAGDRDVGRIIANEETNTIIVTDTPPQLEVIKGLIAELDVPARQVQIEARLVDMVYDAQRDLGMQWNAWRADAQGTAGGPYGTYPGAAGWYPVPSTDSSGGVDNGEPNPVPTELPGEDNPLSVGNVVSSALGVASSAQDYTMSSGPIDILGYSALSGGSFSFGDVVSILGRDFNVAALISAYEYKGLAETLANPKVTTLNNLQASIDIVDQVPYQDSIQEQGVVNVQWQYEDVGIKIIVTPNITPNGFVRLNVDTEQTIQQVSRGGTSGTGRPAVARRQATTNVIVRDRETAMLGGLRQQNSQDIRTGVPWLHEVPLFGWLFKNKSNQSSKYELYLFITPTIIEEMRLTPDETAWYERIDTQWHLPDYFFDDIKTTEDK